MGGARAGGRADGRSCATCSRPTHLWHWRPPWQSQMRWPAGKGGRAGSARVDSSGPRSTPASARPQRLTLAAAWAAACTLPPLHTLAAAAATAWEVAVAAPLIEVALALTMTCTLSANDRG